MATLAELAILLTAKDTASSVIDKVTGKAGGLGKAFIAGAAAGGTALVGMGVALNSLGGEFDSVYDNIRAGTGATGATLDGLKESFRNVVTDIPADFGLAGEVITDLAKRTGQTGKSLEDLSKSIIEMSRLTGTDATANVALATRVFGDWSIATEHQSATLDKVLRAGQLTGISVNELMQKVVQFGAPLRAMNFSFEESVAMLGKWEKEGVNTELVLGSLRIAMGDFARQNIPMRKGLEDTIAEIQRLGPSAAATSLAMKVFGARAGPDMAAAILEGRFALGDLISQIENGEDTILGLGEETADASEKMKLAFNRLKIAAEPLAEVVFLGVAKAADLFAKASLGAIPIMQRLSAVLTTKFQAALPSITAFGKQFVSLGRYIATVVRDGDTLNDFLSDLSPNFRAVAFVIVTSINQLKSLGRAFLDVVQSPIVRWLKDALGSFFEFAFGIRNLGADVASASGPLTIIAGAVSALIAAMAVGAVVAFVSGIAGLAASILTFPLGPLVSASGAVAEFVKNTAGLVSKAITVTANVATAGAEALASLLTDKSINVKPTVSSTESFDEFFSRERIIPTKVDTKLEAPDEDAVKTFSSKLTSLLGAAIGPAIGSAIGTGLIAAAAGVSFVALIPAVVVGATVLAAAFGAFLIVKFKDEFFTGLGAIATVIVEGIKGWATLVSLPGQLFSTAVGAIFEGAKTVVSTIWNELPGLIGGVFSNVLAAVVQFGQDLSADPIGTILGALETASTAFREFPGKVASALGTFVQDTLSGIVDGAKGILEGFAPWEWIKGAIEAFKLGVEGMLSLIDRVKEFFKNPFGGATQPKLPSLGGAGTEGEEESSIAVSEPAFGNARLVTRQAFEEMQTAAAEFTLPAPDTSFFVAAFEEIKTAVPSTLEDLRVGVADGLEAMQQEFSVSPITIPAPVLPEILPLVIPAPDIAAYQTGFIEAHSFTQEIMATIAETITSLPKIPEPDFSDFLDVFARATKVVGRVADGLAENVAEIIKDMVGNSIDAFLDFTRFLSNDFIAGIRNGVSRAESELRQLIRACEQVVDEAMNAFHFFRPWDAVSVAIGTLIGSTQARLVEWLEVIRGASSSASDLYANFPASPVPVPVFQAPQPLPVFVPTPAPPPYEQPPDTSQEDAYSFQTEPGQYKVVPGAPNQPKTIMAHGGEVIGRPFKNVMRGLKSYQTEEGEFKEIDGPLGASIPILAHGGEAIMPMSELRERVATVGFGDKQVVSPFDRAQQTIYEIVNAIVQASHALGSALEEQAGQFLGHLRQTRFGGFIDSVVGIVKSKDLLANEPIFDPSKAIRSWDETFSEFMYRHDLGHLVGPDDRIFEDEFYRSLNDLISQSSGRVTSYQSLDPITGQHESVSRELAAKLSASGSLFPTEVAARILGATTRSESKGEETSKLGIREVFQNPLGELWTRFGGSVEQPPPGFEFSYPEHFGVGIREAFQNVFGDFWTRPLGNSEQPPPGFELAYPETFATAVREVFKNALEEFWTRPAGSEQEPPAGFHFAYPESFQTAPGQMKMVPGGMNQPRLIMAHGGEAVMRPINVSSGLSSSSTSGASGITVNGPLVNIANVSVTNEADEQRLAQTIVQGLEESLDRQFGMSTSFPHGLRGKA